MVKVFYCRTRKAAIRKAKQRYGRRSALVIDHVKEVKHGAERRHGNLKPFAVYTRIRKK